MDIKHLHKQGHSLSAIARITGHSRNTIRRIVAGKRIPRFKTPKRSSKLYPYKDYVNNCPKGGKTSLKVET